MPGPIFLILCGCLLLSVANGAYLWPMPRQYTQGETTIKVDKNVIIEIEVSDKSQEAILKDAAAYWKKYIDTEHWKHFVEWAETPVASSGCDMSRKHLKSSKAAGTTELKTVRVKVEDGAMKLNKDTDESYVLEVLLTGEITINAKSIYGAMHGLSTLSQLVTSVDGSQNQIEYAPWKIVDEPDYKHRGLMLDVSRNWFDLAQLNRVLQGMAMNKMNVLHLHLSDAQSFSLALETLPELKDMSYAKFIPGMIYEKKDIQQLINNARNFGIRIVPEIEMPGHAYATGLPYKDVLVCANRQPDWREIEFQPPSGQFDVTQQATYDLTKKLIAEVSSWFDDQYLHTGGDEVGLRCYKSDDTFRKNLGNKTIHEVMQNYYDYVEQQVGGAGKTPVVWEEALLNKDIDINLSKKFIVQQWTGSSNTKVIVEAGHYVIQSGSDYFYLDVGHGRHAPGWVSCPTCDSYKTWQKIYSHNMRRDLTDEQKKFVLGGEVALWSEQVDEYNLDAQLWPRAAAAAEVMWTGEHGIDFSDPVAAVKRAFPRLADWRYRMAKRGLQSTAMAPLFCIKKMGWCDLAAGYETPKPTEPSPGCDSDKEGANGATGTGGGLRALLVAQVTALVVLTTTFVV